MHILMLTQYFPPEVGAASVRLGAFSRTLEKMGHRVTVITALPNHLEGRIFDGYRGISHCKEAREGADVHRSWVWASQGKGLGRMLGYASFALTSLWPVDLETPPDVLFVESPPLSLGFIGHILALRHRVPMVFYVADLWPDSLVNWGLMKEGSAAYRFLERFERWIYRKSILVNGATEGIVSTLTSSKGVPPARVTLFPNGADMAPANDADRKAAAEIFAKFGDEPGIQWFVYAGTHGYAHGLKQLVEAACRLRESHPWIRILLVGDGSTKQQVQAYAREKKATNVHFHASISPGVLKAIYERALAGVSTLRDDPFFEGTRPAKIFPMMAAGLPVIYAGVGEGARLIEQNGAGLVVPPEKPEFLARALAVLCEAPERCAEMGSKGKAHVLANLSWDALVAEWVDSVEDLLRPAPAPISNADGDGAGRATELKSRGRAVRQAP